MATAEKEGLFEELQQTIRQAVGDRLMLAKMDVAEKSSMLAGKMFFAVIAGSLFFFAMLFFSLMAAYYFSQKFDSFFIGFGIVAGFYLLLLILLVWRGQKWIARKVEDQIISTIFEQEDEQWEQQHSNVSQS
jgi:uncharacterized membrane protein YqjE